MKLKMKFLENNDGRSSRLRIAYIIARIIIIVLELLIIFKIQNVWVAATLQLAIITVLLTNYLVTRANNKKVHKEE